VAVAAAVAPGLAGIFLIEGGLKDLKLIWFAHLVSADAK